MIPVGYMAKHICAKSEFLSSPNVVDIYSVSACVNDDFADYINFWRHNGFWLLDSPEVIQALAQENSIDLHGTSLFYYEAHELEFDGEFWRPSCNCPAAEGSSGIRCRDLLDGPLPRMFTAFM